MFRFSRSIFELILLAVAINILYPHAQAVINNPNQQYWDAFCHEWQIARYPMLVSIGIIILVIVFEIFAIHDERKEQRKSDKRWEALFKHFGIELSQDIKTEKSKRKK
jgi:hypothetical protein